MNILVTGGAGVLGRAICSGLVARGWRVRCVDRTLSAAPGVEAQVADLRQREVVYPLVQDVDAVVHLANHPNHYRTDAQTLVAENTAINVNVFQAALEHGTRHLVFTSSVQVVGGLPRDSRAPEPPPVYPVSGDAALRPGNAYAASKAMAEQLLRYYCEVHGLAATVLRLPYVVRGRRGLERQIAHMCEDTWPHEGFSWLWKSDLPGLLAAVLAAPSAGYRCLLPSAPPMIEVPEVRAAMRAHPNARVESCSVPGWRPTPLAELPGV